jgi:hypothetical protein
MKKIILNKSVPQVTSVVYKKVTNYKYSHCDYHKEKVPGTVLKMSVVKRGKTLYKINYGVKWVLDCNMLRW